MSFSASLFPHSLLCLGHWIMESLNHRLPCGGLKSQAFLITGVGLEQSSISLPPLLFMCSRLREGYTCGLLEAWHTPSLKCTKYHQGALSPILGREDQTLAPGITEQASPTCCWNAMAAPSQCNFRALADGDLEAPILASVPVLPPLCQALWVRQGP